MQQSELRKLFSLFATGVTVVTARDSQGLPVGLTANSLTSVSLDPPLILWCIANQSRHLDVFTGGADFAVHILGESQGGVALKFARSGVAKFEVDAPVSVQGGAPSIEGALARIECHVVVRHLAGDHTVIIGEVDAFTSVEAPPLIFHRSRFGKFAPEQTLEENESWRLLVDMWV